jgi:hypothetical protein
MRKLGAFWLIHFVATVAGWYLLGALAQGAADSQAGLTLPLVVFNGIIQILCFPFVIAAIWVVPGPGGFSLGSFITFAVLAAVNSAVVVAIVAAVVRGVQGRIGAST